MIRTTEPVGARQAAVAGATLQLETYSEPSDPSGEAAGEGEPTDDR